MRWQGMLILFLSIALPSFAGETGGNADRRELAASGLFQRWDADTNGVLHAKEFRAGSSLYREWDVDGNMQLTEDEFYRSAFQYLDKNEDGVLSDDELKVVDGWR